MSRVSYASKMLQLSENSPRKSTQSSAIIQSYVFMKCHVSDSSNPKLTEIAMISLTENDLSHLGSGDDNTHEIEVRCKDSLVLVFDPGNEIQRQDAINSDMSDEDLFKSRKKMQFGRGSVTLIEQFLRLQQKPVCLISHGGNHLDFRFLKMAVQDLGMTYSNDEMLCLDTIDMFLKIDTGKDTACLFDTGRYSLDNVYRRCFKEIPTGAQHDAKSLVMRLIKIYRNSLSGALHAPKLRCFNSIGTLKSQIRPNLESPLKKCRIDGVSLKIDRSQTEDCVAQNLLEQSQCASVKDCIKTFVFIDLETTGLNTAADDIVELCAYAVNKRDLYHDLNGSREVNMKEMIPRLIDQLSIMVLPLSEIPPIPAKINGLTREQLEIRNKECFTIKTARLLEHFLEQNQEPICLVAHNGFKFDYPMLLAHLRRTKTSNPIWNRLYCGDTLPVLRAKYPKQSHKLCHVFSSRFAQDKNAPRLHSAEGDVLRLIAITKCENLLESIQKQKILFMSLDSPHSNNTQSVS